MSPLGLAGPELYIDLGSPYAYFALERAEALFGRIPELQPVLLGAMFAWRGSGSWARGPERAQRIAEVQERAHLYGLPSMVWPAGWPADGLAAMRAATWAKERGRLAQFASSVFRRQFCHGADISDLDVLALCAREAELDPDALRGGIADPEIKEGLKLGTQRAWEAGVRGVPSLRVAQTIWYGDDQLEQAARQLRGRAN